MDDPDETVRILNAEAQYQLIVQRDNELLKIRKLKLVLQELKRLRVSDLKESVESTDQIELAQKVLKVSDYLHLNGEKETGYTLDLGACCTVNLSYTERKAIRQHITKRLQTTLQPIVDFSKKFRTEFPEMFQSYSINAAEPISSGGANACTTVDAEIIALEEQRRKLLEKLVVQRNRKCENLKAAAELKIGPHLGHELEVLYAESRMYQTKASVLQSYLTHSMASSSDHSLKALKEVEGYMDKIIEEKKIEDCK